ncbi:MAG: hypothetical protein JO270_04960 [Acidobacteriaceae bacterium]|nr:hypothetical protein [Acidobacteriaceae bacterium]
MRRARRQGRARLNRLELAGEAGEEDRYKEVHYDAEAFDRVLAGIFPLENGFPAPGPNSGSGQEPG